MESIGAGGSPHWIRSSAAALICGLAIMASAPTLAGVSDRCFVPDTYLKFPTILDRTEDLVGDRRPVRILILGADLPGRAHDRSGPSPLVHALEQRLPGVKFQVLEVRTAGLAEEDFERLRSAVATTNPDLVIWQVGVRDALALNDVDDFESVLDQASAWVDARGLDLVLVDPPFVPQVAHERIYVPYVGEIGEMSRTDGVAVLRRYAAMQYWNIEREKRRAPLSDFTAKQPCVTELLAEAISRASVVATGKKP
ncbi:hypothetical protein [Terrihabitans sp. B22-R8]|uniref:hypothetical protein n=1 Tax=Terrihabitans sp. B22-R8 TaxID=3425128 RepID=UPI00403C12C1